MSGYAKMKNATWAFLFCAVHFPVTIPSADLSRQILVHRSQSTDLSRQMGVVGAFNAPPPPSTEKNPSRQKVGKSTFRRLRIPGAMFSQPPRIPKVAMETLLAAKCPTDVGHFF